MTYRRRLHLALGLLGLLPCLACISPAEGDRATTGTCPEGETCSTTTSGLYFRGTSTLAGDDWAHVGTLVVGGTEHVTLYAGASRETATPFAGDYDVVSDTPSVMTAEIRADGYVELRGVGAGNATLRVLEEGTNVLIDRVVVGVVEAGTPRVRSVELDEMQGYDWTDTEEAPRFRLFRGAHVDLRASVTGAAIDSFVVDTDLVVRDAQGHVLVRGIDQVPYRFALDVADAAPLSLTVHTAGTDTPVTLEVAEHVDGVRIETHALADGSSVVCAIATSGGVAVVGAPSPTFSTPSGPLARTSAHCAPLAAASSAGTVTATIGGATATTTFASR